MVMIKEYFSNGLTKIFQSMAKDFEKPVKG